MSNGKSYMPKILTCTGGKKFGLEEMEDEIAKYTLNGWKTVSMTQFQSHQPMYTVLLQYEFSEEEMQARTEKRA